MANLFNQKRKLILNLKNIPGWKTDRKIIVFSFDDFGNIRLASKKARENMRKAGLNVEQTRFDLYDGLENREDLTNLFEVLSSVKDKFDRHPVITAFTCIANPDFEKIKADNFQKYSYELLPVTFNKLNGYEGTWDLWQEGIQNKLIFPQFHGREHLNLKFFMEALQNGEREALIAFENRCFAAISIKPYPTIGFTEAFSFNHFSENEQHKVTLKDGLKAFENVFGFKAKHFAAPGAREHNILESTLNDMGIKFVDTDFVKKEHQGNGNYKTIVNYNGKKNKSGQTYVVRNCLFEPVQIWKDFQTDWVDYCLKQIEIAFKWNKPANISSHRVNYTGSIEQSVREIGLTALRDLLTKMVKKWPDIEFLTTVELGELMNKSN